MFAEDGRLWVKRTVVPGKRPLYDVIGDSGQLVQRVTFPANTRVVGFGTGHVYVARRDADDLEHLERFLLPSQ